MRARFVLAKDFAGEKERERERLRRNNGYPIKDSKSGTESKEKLDKKANEKIK